MSSKRRTSFLILLSAVAVVAVAFAVAQYRQAKAANLRLQAFHQRALYSLISHVENIEASLSKARAASTPSQQGTFLTSCYSHAEAARDSLAQVPVTGVDQTSLRQFIARTGDFSLVLAQRLARGGAVTPDEWSELERLESGVKDVAGKLLTTAQKVRAGGVRAGILGALGFGTAATLPSADALSQGFSEIDQITQSIPSPVYDGPFSEKNLSMMALAKPGPEIPAEEAKAIALSFLLPGESFRSVSVGTIDGAIPCFLVSAKRADGSEVMTAVAKQGGAVLWAQDGRRLGAAKVDMQSARNAATAFLASKGFSGLIETGWRKPGPAANRIVFTYVPTASVDYSGSSLQVILYPDTVKVEVGLDSGGIVAFDQKAYLTTHDSPSRKIPSPLVGKQEAAAVLKPGLVVEGQPRLAVVPILPTTETLAWEFRVKQGSDTYLVYVNAMTGREDIVLRLIEDATGAMAV